MPHPNEWVHIKLIEELNKRFTLLDDFDKVKRLNGSKAIFIGTISSFLYEAGVAGHLVAYLKIYEKATPRFHFDFACEPLNINSLIDWIKNISSIEYSNSQHQILNEHSSLERFISALHAAKLVDNSDLRN